ncbi:MAG: SpoIID/LytB domain-containing protein [Parcubacteria group bacterium]|jgi:hypothetical protein
MQKEKIRKIAYSCLFIAVFISTSGGFFVGQNVAEAAKSKVTKWQTKLVKAGIGQTLWQKYLPKISRKECNKVMKAWKKAGASNTTAQTEVAAQTNSLGSEIAVGLWYNSKDDIFKIDANKAYNIKDKNGGVIAQVAGDSTTRVKYDDDGKLKVYSSIAETLVDDNVTFDAADGNNSDIIFDTDRSIKSEWGDYSHFRGKIEVNYYHGDDIYNGNSSSTTQIWIINKLPLEQYVWGAGETTGTGDSDHVRVMTTIFRTYGKWYIDNATKYKPMGFKIRSDAGSQIYLGYDREEKYPNVRKAAEDTRGRIVKYDNETALTPYCSYTDGKTRALKGYPYLKSVKDHKKGTKKSLNPGDGGNHMWGLSAHGALGYAEDGKSWDWILKHYYSGVDIDSAY